MVGVPRSTGCSLCRKRRVKCDEERPACGNCRKYGAGCPGYDRGLKFVSGKHPIRQRGQRPLRDDGAPSSSSRSQSSGDELAPALMVTELSQSRAQFLGTILELLRPSVSQYDVVGLFAWVQLDRLGQKAALDGAMCSLTLHLFGKEYSDQAMLAYSRRLYGQSLCALQAALRHPTEWRSSETLCSAILLCVYELFEGTSSEAWLQHARGIGVLMEQRGPAAHAHGWDATMILSFRGILIMGDMFYPASDHCFLARPEWRAVIRDGGRHLVHAKDIEDSTIRVMDGFFENLANVPAVLKLGFGLREANMYGIAIEPERVAALANHAADAHRRFSQWHQDAERLDLAPEEIPSEDPTSLYDSVLSYKTPWAGSMYMAYWASMLILEETLVQCQWPENFEDSKKENLKSILRSVETVGKGILGPYRLGYSLRIAYDFASVEAQHWLRNLLDVYSKSYAATDKATYPSPRIDQRGYA